MCKTLSSISSTGNKNKKHRSWEQWCMPIIPALRRLIQEDCKFKVSLSYIVRPCLKTKTGKKEHTNDNSLTR
jgi:hypothetical protein